MSGRDNRSARMVIMDDISWSEPTPRSHRASAELDAPEWMQPPEAGFASRGEVDHLADEPFPRAASHRRPGSRPRAEIVPDAAPAGDYRDESLDEDLGELVGRWRSELAAAPPGLESAAALDEEQIWGPRPKLMADRPGGRRTVVITGRGADRYVAPRAGARGSVPVHARHGFAADRTAMWAVLLCVILLLVALTSH